MAQTARPDRPTQEQRTDAMRARLLEATLELIREDGWAQTSTQKVCKRAGVSRGAQTHHFPTKDSLLIAAVREIVARRQAELEGLAETSPSSEQTLEAVFEFLWESCFDGDLLTCWMDAMVAARTDEALRPVVRQTDSRAINAMRALGPACETGLDQAGVSAADRIELSIYLLRGMVVQSGVHPDQAARRRLFDLWKQLVL